MISATVVSSSVYLYNRITPTRTLPGSPAEEDTEERLLGEIAGGAKVKVRPAAATRSTVVG